MKTLTLLFLLFNISGFCQGLSEIEMSIKFYSDHGRTEVCDNQKPGEFITGVLFSNLEPKFVGSGEAFLKVLPDNYQKKKYEFLTGKPDTSLSNEDNYPSSLAEKPDKILRYSFYLESVSNNLDSINLYFKYILYLKKVNSKPGETNYDASLHETFFTLPLNRSTSIEYFNKIFPEADSITALFKLTASSGETPRLDLADYSLDIKSISPAVRNSNNDKLIFSGEYIRTNKEGNKILLRKQFKFTAEDNIISSRFDNSVVFPMTVNWGFASVPYKNFNPVNESLFTLSKEYAESRIDFNLMLLPTDKKNNLYTFNLFIKRFILSGGYTYSKTIKIKKGQKLKVELDDAAGLFRHEVIEGKDLYIDVKKDYSAYVKEYLVLSLK